MKLSQQQLEHYREKGWLVVNGVYDAATVDRVVAEAMRVSEAQLKAESNSERAAFMADRAEDGTLAPRKIDKPFLTSPVFRAFVLDDRLEALLAELLHDKPLLAKDQLFMKPPRFGSAKPYHQDNAYFLCTPSDHVITAWIALDDVDESNGCLRYIDGSHKQGIIPHVPIPEEPHNKAPRPEQIDLTRESLAIVKRGGVVFHHGETLHTSHRNTSDRWRRGYATHWVTADVTSEINTVENAYFRTEALA